MRCAADKCAVRDKRRYAAVNALRVIANGEELRGTKQAVKQSSGLFVSFVWIASLRSQ